MVVVQNISDSSILWAIFGFGYGAANYAMAEEYDAARSGGGGGGVFGAQVRTYTHAFKCAAAWCAIGVFLESVADLQARIGALACFGVAVIGFIVGSGELIHFCQKCGNWCDADRRQRQRQQQQQQQQQNAAGPLAA